MADTKVSDETAATALDGTELTRIVQGGSSKKTTLAVAGHQFRGAKAKMTSDDTAQNATSSGVVISFDAASFDTDSFWSAGSPTRLTIPASKGITHVELTGQVHVTSSTGDSQFSVVIIQWSSADAVKEAWNQRFVEMGGATKALSIGTGPVAVEDGDYFTLTVIEETDNSVTIEGDSSITTFLALHVIGMEPV